MGATKLDTFLSLIDKNGVSVGSWAEQKQAGKACCRFCECVVSFAKVGRCLTTHSMTAKHIHNHSKEGSQLRQLTVTEALSGRLERDGKEQEEKLKTTQLEIDVARALGYHKIPNSFLNCLQAILKKHCDDSFVINRMRLQRSKGDYMACYGIGKPYQDETVKLLQTCDAFSIGFDESEVGDSCQAVRQGWWHLTASLQVRVK